MRRCRSSCDDPCTVSSFGMRIEDYALIGDTQTAALVGRNGSIDWLCVPQFDSRACFAALVGTPEHGHWQIAPHEPGAAVKRRYRGHSLVLETEFRTPAGAMRVVDCMPPRQGALDVVRVVEGMDGEVTVDMELVIRFDYGSIVPWVRRVEGMLVAIGGPDALSLWTPVRTHGVGLTTRAQFTVRPGERVPFVLQYHRSHEPPRRPIDAVAAVEDTQRWWQRWSARCTYEGEWREAVLRSLIVLKALTFAPTGGMVAAATTSLPECIGGVRNWDYRFCWLRDATFTLYSFIAAGYTDEAVQWRAWLLRAVAGDPSALQIMYGPGGERRLTELELPWLPGYEASRPVRIGNAAVSQVQLDVFGEMLDAMCAALRAGVAPDPAAWALERKLVTFLEEVWQQPDEGIWEVRGPRRHFTHSKVMAWVAVDRAIRIAQEHGFPAPLARWRRLREDIHREVCEKGFDRTLGSFTQFYGARTVDASLLMLPLVGFLPPEDPRCKQTVATVERELMRGGFLQRYRTEQSVDGLPGGEGVFLPCTFWLADNYALQGRRDEAARIYEMLLGLTNDVGLLSEQYDPVAKRLLGNFPQAFSHVSLVNTAMNITQQRGPAEHRRSAAS